MEKQTKNKEVEDNTYNNLQNINMNVLLPKLLDKNEAAYKSVEELNRAITLAMKEKRVRNIALTLVLMVLVKVLYYKHSVETMKKKKMRMEIINTKY